MSSTKIPLVYGSQSFKRFRLNAKRKLEEEIDFLSDGDINDNMNSIIQELHEMENSDDDNIEIPSLFPRLFVLSHSIPQQSPLVTASSLSSRFLAILEDSRAPSLEEFVSNYKRMSGWGDRHKQKCRKRSKTDQNSIEDACTDSINVTDYVLQRNYGKSKGRLALLNCSFAPKHMTSKGLFQEQILKLPNVNKIFCSQWLSDNQVIMGTKCNQLLVYDTKSKRTDLIPCLKGSSNGWESLSKPCGIHAIEVNPSKTLLATGAEKSNEIGIYRLPTLDPVCMGEKAHKDWIFDVCWLDDQFLVSGSRDKYLSLWKVDDNLLNGTGNPSDQANQSPSYSFMEPVCRTLCEKADKIRSLVFNPRNYEIVALSLNSMLHVYDAGVFKYKMSHYLGGSSENVCLTKDETCSMYVVGGEYCATFIDPRSLCCRKKVSLDKSDRSIRTISFREDILTIGTGTGEIIFYDTRACKFLDGINGKSSLCSSKCPVQIDNFQVNPYSAQHNNNNNNAIDTIYSSAIYTHCYDWSGTRLFTAGGPLSASYKGNYAALWC